VALVWANVSLDGYEAVWDTKLGGAVGGLDLRLDLRHWVNEGLMAISFFVVGLEINRELVAGELKDRRAATLPGAPTATASDRGARRSGASASRCRCSSRSSP
jgi:Na+/H+ antiporter NhaA